MRKSKILKVLSVGALAVMGTCAFTGCMASGAEITEEEKKYKL